MGDMPRQPAASATTTTITRIPGHCVQPPAGMDYLNTATPLAVPRAPAGDYFIASAQDAYAQSPDPDPDPAADAAARMHAPPALPVPALHLPLSSPSDYGDGVGASPGSWGGASTRSAARSSTDISHRASMGHAASLGASLGTSPALPTAHTDIVPEAHPIIPAMQVALPEVESRLANDDSASEYSNTDSPAPSSVARNSSHRSYRLSKPLPLSEGEAGDLQSQINQLNQRLSAAALQQQQAPHTPAQVSGPAAVAEKEAAALTSHLAELSARMSASGTSSRDAKATAPTPAVSVSSGSEYGSDADTHEEEHTHPQRSQAVSGMGTGDTSANTSATTEQLRVQAALEAEADARNPNRPRTLQEARARARARAQAKRTISPEVRTSTPDLETQEPSRLKPGTLSTPAIALELALASPKRSGSLGRRPARSPRRLSGQPDKEGVSCASSPGTGSPLLTPAGQDITALDIPLAKSVSDLGENQGVEATPTATGVPLPAIGRTTTEPLTRSPEQPASLATNMLPDPAHAPIPEPRADVYGIDCPWPEPFFSVVPLAQQASGGRFLRAATHFGPVRKLADGRLAPKSASISGPLPTPAAFAVAYAQAARELLGLPSGLQVWENAKSQPAAPSAYRAKREA